MNNKDKYKKAFSTMHISNEFSLEVKKMKTISNKSKINRLIVSICICMIILGSATIAYATDFYGIKRTIQLWIYGEQSDVKIESDDKENYSMEYIDDEGNNVRISGGATTLEGDGADRTLTEDEIIEILNFPEVRYKEDGSVWIYYYDQKIDITNKFKDGICYEKVSNGKETLYMTIIYKDGWSTSQDKYIIP